MASHIDTIDTHSHSHFHIHTHTHTHSLSLSHSLTPPLGGQRGHAKSPNTSNRHSHSLSLSHSPLIVTLTHSLPLSPTLSLSHSTLTLSLSLSLTLTLSLTLSLTLTLALTTRTLTRSLAYSLHPLTARATKSALQGPPSPAPATKSANEPHGQKSRFTAPVTKSERVEDHHHVQSPAPATKSALRSKTAPIPCTCHEKSTLDHQITRFPVTTMSENACSATTRAQSRHPPRPTKFCEPAQSKCTSRISRAMNVL